MKLVVGAAFALGLVLGGGQTIATQMVADDVVSVDDPTTEPAPEETPTEDTQNDSSDDTEEPEVETTDVTLDDAADVNYGALVSTWVHCLQASTDCGDRPHPPGNAFGWLNHHTPEEVEATEESTDSTEDSTEGSTDSTEDSTEESSEDGARGHGPDHAKKAKKAKASHRH